MIARLFTRFLLALALLTSSTVALARFISIDPVPFEENNIHSFNRYAYGNNNPYRFKDPDGRAPTELYKEGRFGGTIGMSGYDRMMQIRENEATLRDIGPRRSLDPSIRAAEQGAKSASRIDAVINETLSGKGNMTSTMKLGADDMLKAGEKFLGAGYREIGKSGSGVFRSADGTRQFRIEEGSLSGSHKPGVPHGHLEVYKPGANKPSTNNHIPLSE